jgi:hypothetical protein
LRGATLSLGSFNGTAASGAGFVPDGKIADLMFPKMLMVASSGVAS